MGHPSADGSRGLVRVKADAIRLPGFEEEGSGGESGTEPPPLWTAYCSPLCLLPLRQSLRRLLQQPGFAKITYTLSKKGSQREVHTFQRFAQVKVKVNLTWSKNGTGLRWNSRTVRERILTRRRPIRLLLIVSQLSVSKKRIRPPVGPLLSALWLQKKADTTKIPTQNCSLDIVPNATVIFEIR